MLREAKAAERAVYLAYLLFSGRQLTTDEAAEITAVSQRTAQRDFLVLERALPVYRDDDGRLILRDTDGMVQISPY